MANGTQQGGTINNFFNIRVTLKMSCHHKEHEKVWPNLGLKYNTYMDVSRYLYLNIK